MHLVSTAGANAFFHLNAEADTTDINVENGAGGNQFLGGAWSTATVSDKRTLIQNYNAFQGFLTTNVAGEMVHDTQDSNAAQVPSIHFKKTVAGADYFRIGRILNTDSGVGVDSNGIMSTAAGGDFRIILDGSSGSPLFRVDKKGTGSEFYVDLNGNSWANGKGTFNGGLYVTSNPALDNQIIGSIVEQELNPPADASYFNFGHIAELFTPSSNTKNLTGQNTAGYASFSHFGSGNLSAAYGGSFEAFNVRPRYSPPGTRSVRHSKQWRGRNRNAFTNSDKQRHCHKPERRRRSGQQ